jgi:hypothetical protein
MKIAFVFDNKLHWITPYTSFEEIPEHPPNDLYVFVQPTDAQEGWLFDYETKTFSPPPEPEEIMPVIDPIEALDKRLQAIESGFMTMQKEIKETLTAVQGELLKKR